MSQRERILSIIVGGLLVLAAVYWGFNKYRGAVQVRRNQIQQLQDTQLRLVEQQMQGARADRQMGEYMVRSLPGNQERARSEYSRWLLDTVQKNKLRGANVDPAPSVPIGDLYRKHGFRVDGKGEIKDILNMLHDFYAKDYLHRIRQLELRPNKQGGFDIKMGVDAIGLNNVPIDAKEPGSDSWRVESEAVAYVDPIMNRNMFEPPNEAPRYTGKSTVEAVVGKDTPIPLTFKDPQNQRINYELISGPEGMVRLDGRSGTLRVKSDEKEEFEVKVLATDEGYPRKSTEQTLIVKFIDPPQPPPPPEEKLKFDDATQTVLTGLTHGKGDWQAWMKVMTRGDTLKLRVGDKFEIGTVKGTVTEINAKLVELEFDGKRVVISSNSRESLKDAATRAKEDEAK